MRMAHLLLKQKTKTHRLLGQHPKNGQNIYVVLTKIGPALQIGDIVKTADYVSIPEEYSMDKITYQEALVILQFPKDLGQLNGKNVVIKKGPYGYYLAYNGKNTTIPKTVDVNTVDLPLAQQIINEAVVKAQSPKKDPDWILGKFTEGTETIQILKGKGSWPPYIKKGDKNIPLKGHTDETARKLTLPEIKSIITAHITGGSSSGSGSSSSGSSSTGSKNKTVTKSIPKIVPKIEKKTTTDDSNSQQEVPTVKKIAKITKKI